MRYYRTGSTIFSMLNILFQNLNCLMSNVSVNIASQVVQEQMEMYVKAETHRAMGQKLLSK